MKRDAFTFFYPFTAERSTIDKQWGSKWQLSVSCPSANEFSAIFLLLFARLSSNSPRSFQRFRQTLRQNFNWIRQQMKNFPIWGKFFTRCKIWMKFCTRVHLNSYNDRGEFELDRAKSKKKMPKTRLH